MPDNRIGKEIHHGDEVQTLCGIPRSNYGRYGVTLTNDRNTVTCHRCRNTALVIADARRRRPQAEIDEQVADIVRYVVHFVAPQTPAPWTHGLCGAEIPSRGVVSTMDGVTCNDCLILLGRVPDPNGIPADWPER